MIVHPTKTLELSDGSLVKLTDAQVRFLAGFLRSGGQKSQGALEAGVDYYRHWSWLANSPDYKKAFEEFKLFCAEMRWDEAVRRAHDGVPKPIFHQGLMCGIHQQYSDSLLLAFLKTDFPGFGRDSSEVRHTDADGKPLFADPGRSQLPDEKLQKILTLLDQVKATEGK
jgi:hypothetical protein